MSTDYDRQRGLYPLITDADFNVINQLDVGSEMSQSCGGGLALGELVHVSRPQVDISICDPIGIHVPQSICEKMWAGCYIDLALLLKQTGDLRTDAHTTREIVIKNKSTGDVGSYLFTLGASLTGTLVIPRASFVDYSCV